MAKVKPKSKTNDAVKPKLKPVAKIQPPAPAAKTSKPITAQVEKSAAKPKTTTSVIKKPAAAAPATKPSTGKVEAKLEKASVNGNGKSEKPGTGKVAKKSTTELLGKPAAPSKFATRSKPETITERVSKIPVVKREELAGLTSPFDRKEMKEWRAVLISKRNEITNDIDGLVKDAMEAEDGHTTPNHIAERGSDADLQEFSLGMVGEEKADLWLIDRALRKIDECRPVPFGLCEYNKRPIQKSRLDLLPWTPLSIDGAQYMEENNLNLEDMLIED